MVRSPCCEKMGMKKGPWTPEEDQILIAHIQRYGHANWRALPKQAGLLRCGKSCRLRWINYLRPDIKRGKFTKEEVATIIELHRILGNRWSTIAARLPGRTDNEIKNFWHTHLKKHERLSKVHTTISTSRYPLQETQETSSSVDDASGATSSVTGKLLIANEHDSLSSRRNPPTIGMGFYGTVSCDISGESETMGRNNTHNEMGEEMEFWYQLFISSYHKGMEI